MFINTNDDSSFVKDTTSPRNKYTESYTMSLRAQSTGPSGTQGLFQQSGQYEEPASPSRFRLGCYAEKQSVDPPSKQKFSVMQSHTLYQKNAFWSEQSKANKTMRPVQGIKPILQSIPVGRKKSSTKSEHRRIGQPGPYGERMFVASLGETSPLNPMSKHNPHKNSQDKGLIMFSH